MLLRTVEKTKETKRGGRGLESCLACIPLFTLQFKLQGLRGVEIEFPPTVAQWSVSNHRALSRRVITVSRIDCFWH